MTAHKHLRTPLVSARGLGSARDGTHHWWTQRILAIALVPLSLWFIGSILSGAVHSSADGVAEWMGNPINAVAIILFLAAMFYHAKLGMQVIVEDYVHNMPAKVTLLMINNFVFTAAAVVSILAVAKLHFIDPITLL